MTKTKTPAATKVVEKKPKKELSPAWIRFVYLYLSGGPTGEYWSNATLAYFYAVNDDDTPRKDKDGNFTKDYNAARVLGPRLLLNVAIQKYIKDLLNESGYTPDAIKKRYQELSSQNKNLPVAVQATDRVAKIAGVLKDEPTKVNIPELEALGDAIKRILG